MIPVVDVFSGPGGLNEGFAQVMRHGQHAFNIVASFEMENHAVRTLTLRTAVRDTAHDGLPRVYRRFLAQQITLQELLDNPSFSRAHEQASEHIHQIELGELTRGASDERIQQALKGRKDWVLVGGPPCQAYSLVGRARRTHDETFSEDKKHFLYREYLHIIDRFRPAVFLMENVPGIVSAQHSGNPMFPKILEDLALDGAYELRSVGSSNDEPKGRDFAVWAHHFGVPQSRRRVFVLGIRRDVASDFPGLERSDRIATVHDALSDLEHVAADFSRRSRTGTTREAVLTKALELAQPFVADKTLVRPSGPDNTALMKWLNPHNAPLSLHEPRPHMASDLARYAFLARLAEYGEARLVQELPDELRPAHKNITRTNVPFADRFKVQRWDHPSRTVASHISKDGHAYIHPDPLQMRSLTVREAARLQTFPDDYFFCGPRTSQYQQVGNAVPPLLAHQIGHGVAKMLGQ